MAIKYRWHNLERRVINGRDVEKVIYNWREIWPQETQHVDYHIVSPWTWGWAPSWWSTWWGWWWGWGGWHFGPWWFYWWTAQYDWLPSLRNARKIKIVYQFTRTLASVPVALDGRLLRMWSRTYQTQLVSWRDQLFWCANNITDWFNAVPWLYTITTEIELSRNTATQVLEWPDWLTSDVWTYVLTNSEVNNIRNSDQFLITLNNWVTLRQTDFYIWNEDSSSFIEWWRVWDLSDFTNMLDIVAALNNSWYSVWSNELLMPNVWYISYSSWNFVGASSYIWLTSVDWASWVTLNLRTSDMKLVADWYRGYWQFVRPILDTFYMPDSSWTTIVWTIWWDWIFHNPNLEVITLMAGPQKLSIADKNLWATQAWYPWDSATPSNYGKFYQWWNCYWFPASWFNKSNQRVDTTWYWWAVTYSSDTFIYWYDDWSNPPNDYLW